MLGEPSALMTDKETKPSDTAGNIIAPNITAEKETANTNTAKESDPPVTAGGTALQTNKEAMVGVWCPCPGKAKGCDKRSPDYARITTCTSLYAPPTR